MLLLLIVAVLVIYFSIFLKRHLRVFNLSNKEFYGMPAYPLIGNALQFVNKSNPEIFEMLRIETEKSDGCLRTWIGTNLTILVSDVKIVEEILTSQVLIDKARDYHKLDDWLGAGLLLSTGKKWHQRRKVITPAFHFKILEQFIDVFNKKGEIFIDVLSKHSQKKSFELYPLVTLYALDVICETAMGTSIDAQLNLNSEYVKAVKDEVHILQRRFVNILLQSNFLFKYSSHGKMERKALKVMHDFADNVIQNRREELSRNQSNEKDFIADDLGIKRRQAFLDVLLKSTIDGKYLTNEEIREEVDTFMFEGHDTTTSAITFCFYNLAKNPEIQEKCFKEIVDTIGAKENAPTLSQLNELNYLEKVIKETLRLYPSVPVVGRSISKDTVIGGKTFPAGCSVGINFYAMGRDPKYFDNPLEFRPERFDSENLNKINTFSYVPFSAGPRNCIGQKFAMLEMKSVVAKVLRNFEVKLADNEDLVLYSELILRPHSKIYFQMTPRIC